MSHNKGNSKRQVHSSMGLCLKKKIKRANSHIINLAPCLNALEESEEIKRKIKYCVTYIYLNLFCQ